MSKRSKGGDIVLKYCQKYPGMSTRALAEVIFENEGDYFNSSEHARSMVRYYRQSNGEKNRNRLSKEVRETVFVTGDEFSVSGGRLPVSYKKERNPFLLKSNKILVLPDVHVPYHDEKALLIAMEYGQKHGVNGILFNGDLIDFHQISRWEKDPKKRSTFEEIEAVIELLEMTREEFSDCDIVYKLGNHDERLLKYLRRKAPELEGIKSLDINELFNLKDFDIQLVGDLRIIKAGDLNILHGHELPGSGGTVNPARNYYLKVKDNVMVGHVHRTSEHREKKKLKNEHYYAYTTGCLCELNPDYMPYNYFNLGFAVIEVYEDGSFHVDNKMIEDYKVR